jgi:hypothetical protein
MPASGWTVDATELEQQRDEITALYSSAVRGSSFSHAVPDRIALDGTLSLDWPAAEVLIDGLAEELCFAGPLVERMARARATIDGLRQGLGAGRSFGFFLERAAAGHRGDGLTQRFERVCPSRRSGSGSSGVA